MEPKEPMTLALTPEQAEEMWTWDDDKILAARGAESDENLKKLIKAQGMQLGAFAERCGLTLEAMREGVKKGGKFERTPGAFDAMCSQLGFRPSEAGDRLGGIYAVQARGEAIDARGAALARLLQMEDVYRRIKDPIDREIADVAIDALWCRLNLLAGREG